MEPDDATDMLFDVVLGNYISESNCAAGFMLNKKDLSERSREAFVFFCKLLRL